jgi:hypothetical protein
MRFFYVVIVALAAAMTGCSSNNAKPSNAESAPQPEVTIPSSIKGAEVDACSLFTADDAQQILGVPMKNFPESNKGVCRYDEASPKEGTIGGNVSITINTYATPAQADLAWRQLKEVRHLQEGEKNVHKLDGMGQEAYFTGNREKGKVGVAAVIARKDRAELMLDSMVLEYRASPDAMTSIAKRILDQLP